MKTDHKENSKNSNQANPKTNTDKTENTNTKTNTDKTAKRPGLLNVLGSFFMLFVYLIRGTASLITYVYHAIVNRIRFSIRLRLLISYVFTSLFIVAGFSILVMIALNRYAPQEYIDELLPLAWNILLVGSCLGLLIGIISGARAGKRIVEPIYQMNDTVEEISIGTLSKRIDVSGAKDELKDLAGTFNSMMDKIETSVEKQNQFVSDASHELRTPISVIKGYADLLNRWGKEDPEVRNEAIQAIRMEADHMNKLIEKLLFLARGDMKVQKIEVDEFYLDDLLEEIYKETLMIDQEHTIKLEQSEHHLMYADRRMLKEALRIFVENSIKYTPAKGTITLSGYKEKNDLRISIKDTGIGVKKEELKKIFDRFYRADKSRTRESGGTGLGLAIAKWIVDSHKGKILAKSKEGVGTEFIIVLPDQT